MRTKKESERKRKKVLRTGSKRFIACLGKGETVRVTWKDWITYWASVQDPNRERYREALETNHQYIKRLQEQLAVSQGLFDETVRVLGSEKDRRTSLETKYSESIEKNEGIKELLTALLVPWADSLGRRELTTFVEAQTEALEVQVSPEVINEVIIDVFTSITCFLRLNESNDNSCIALEKAHEVLKDRATRL
ncbi:MAG: hypothetical protein A2735_01165 [Candidatus Yanofskybacteria bacterium RIFCSPHIGHO2_01_FULL_41_21]|uniref:Uncharacterized protein n=1 Tax=Candidatus Yanofskybacteria bacterium RIFCSPHIGHO2_01_FULL_41_21 TaxID=1802660 RepID=A0A1F8ECQ5_9BACT|nr:MAG: hypothetical protein A2735_01165 [Candidatus Yanofskybacteria bacterium RIFCSPHIGHO2_01_FULL_41_21]